MPIKIQCDGCGQRYSAPDPWRGQTKTCPNCGAALKVPYSEGGLVELSPEEIETSDSGTPSQTLATPDTDLGSDLNPLVELADLDDASSDDDPLAIPGDGSAAAGSSLLLPQRKTATPSFLRKVPWRLVVRYGVIAGALFTVVGFVWYIVGSVRSAVGPSSVVGVEPLVWNVQITPVTPPPMDVADYAIDASSSSVWLPPRHRRFCIISRRQAAETTHEIWNLATGKLVKTLDDSPKTKRFLNIDRDGKFLAALGAKDENGGIEVIPLVSGYQPHRFDGEFRSSSFVEFLPRDRIVMGVPMPSNKLGILTWDLKKSAKVGGFEIRGARDAQMDVSPDGRYLAVAGDRIVLFDLDNGGIAGELDTPASHRSLLNRVRYRRLRFSHDGGQLAAMCEDGASNRVLCWDTATGTGVYDYVVQRWYEAVGNRGFEWVPDDSGWFCFGRQLVARDNGLTVWGSTTANYGCEVLGPLNDRWTLVHWDTGKHVLEPIPMPRQEIAARRQALQDNGAAWVKPGQAVGLKISIESVRFGNKDDAEQVLRDAVVQRLDQLGLPVERGQPAVLEVAYSESEGEALGEVENSGHPFPMPHPMPNERFTGKTIVGTKALLTLRWIIPGRADPAWQTQVEIDPSWMELDRPTDEAASQETRETAQHRISDIAIPYFVAKSSGEPAMLPYFTDYQRRHEAPTESPPTPPSTGIAETTSTVQTPEDATADGEDPKRTPLPHPTPPSPTVRDREPLPEQPKRIPWTASADPPRLPLEFRRGKIQVGLPSFGDFKFSVIPSTLLFVHGKDRDREGVGIVDLSTGKQQAVINGEFDLYEPYDFSPTGTYLAAPERRRSTKINVWSFETGQILRQLELGEGPRLEAMHFVGPRHLLLARNDHDEVELVLWNVEQDSPQQRIRVVGTDSGQWYRRGSLASTPGGKYVALMMGQLLSFYDLTSGKCVGQLALPEEIRDCHGVSFAPDGSQVAALVRVSDEIRLWCWDMVDGDLLREHQYNEDVAGYVYSYAGPAVEWIPDGSGWLFGGHVLVDGESGRPAWDFPKTTRDPRRMLAKDRLLVMMKSGRDRGIADVKLPAQDLEKAVATVRAGGEMIDSLLPALTTADWFHATAVSLPNGVISWRVLPAPKPTAEAPVGRPIAIGGEYHDIQSVRFAGGDSNKVVVHKEIRPPSKAGRRIPPKYVIERYDVATAAKGKELPLPQLYRLLDVAPSGSRALVGLYLNRKQERIDVLSLSPRKHVAGWRPYGEQKDTHIEQAVFVDDETVLTVNSAGTLVAWKMPDCRAAYAVKEFGKILALTPDRKHLFGEQDAVCRIFDAATGECCGELESPTLGTTASWGAFHPDGQRLAGLVRDRYAAAIVTWDLRDGKRLCEFPIPTDIRLTDSRLMPESALAIDWRGADHLLLGGRYLVDVERQAVVWRYHPSGVHAVNTPDGRHWCSGTRRLRDKNTQFLAALPMPSSLVAQRTVGVRGADQIVLGPGDRVALTVHVRSVPGLPDLRQRVLDNLTTSLQLREIQVDPSAPVQLKLTSGGGTTGTTLAVTDTFGRPSESNRTFAQQKLVCTLTLTDETGKVAWQRDRNITMRSFGMVEEQDVRRELQAEMQEDFGAFVSGDVAGALGLPKYVFRPLDEIIAGETTISLQGETAAPQPAGR